VSLAHYLSYLVLIFDDNDSVPDSYKPLNLIQTIPDCGLPKRRNSYTSHLLAEAAIRMTQRAIEGKVQKTLDIVLIDDQKKKKLPPVPEFVVVLKKKTNPDTGKDEYE
jgi:hypothetical protein